VEITAGAEHLACLRLREGGLARWHTGCCRTAIGNSLATPNVPFIGLIRGGCLDADRGGPTDAAIGPIRGEASTAASRAAIGRGSPRTPAGQRG
jgi:hypothetical protein